MFRFLFTLVVLATLLVGIGFYRGWFHLKTDRAADTSSVTVTMDKDKIQEDKNKTREKVEALSHKLKDTATTPTENSKNP